mgnify:CR=1 FL=1
MMIKIIIGIILGVFVIVFMAQNTAAADITFLKWTFSVSSAVMYLIIFAIGLVAGGLTVGIKGSRNRKKLK